MRAARSPRACPKTPLVERGAPGKGALSTSPTRPCLPTAQWMRIQPQLANGAAALAGVVSSAIARPTSAICAVTASRSCDGNASRSS